MKNIFIILFIVVLFTIPFWIFNLDIKVQKIFFSINDGWKFGNLSFINFLYKFSIYPALFFALFSILVLGLSSIYDKLIKFRKVALIFLLTLIIGPGILANVIGKNFTGRPRPREITEFNGNWKFKKPFELGIPGKGHSFPCGHATMGFVFYAIYVAIREKNKLKARFWLLFSIIFGFLIGLARIMQGAHFFSDVIWALGITFISAELANLIFFKIEKYVNEFANQKYLGIKISVTILLIVFLIFTFLIATPFYREKKYFFSEIKEKIEFKSHIDEGDLNIKNSDIKNIKLNLIANGFAMPKRKYEEKVDFENKEDKTVFNLEIKKSGIFSELDSFIDVELPEIVENIVVINKKGKIKFDAKVINENIVFYTKKGDIVFSLRQNSLIKNIYLKTRNGNIIILFDENIKIKGPANFFIFCPLGEVIFLNKSNYFLELLKEKEKLNWAKEIIFKSKEADGITLNILAKRILLK